MLRSTHRAAALLMAGLIPGMVTAQAPGTPPPMGAATLPPPALTTPPVKSPSVDPLPTTRPPGVAAKVNNQDIAEVAVFRAVRQFPASEQPVARREILGHLIDNVLIDQYLNAINIKVEPAAVEKMLGELKEELKKSQKDYAAELAAMMLTEDEFRLEVAAQMKWDKFVEQQSTDEKLKKLFEQMPSTFDGSMVRVRHILMTPGVDPAKVDEAQKTLLAIKQTVEAEAAKQATGADALAKEQSRGVKTEELFGEYAKKYSMCPSKTNGGDLNFFPRVGAMVESFSAASFGLAQFQMSEVVKTEHGYHMILCTAKKPGTPRKFEQVKDDVKAVYAIQLREAVVNQMKPRAQIQMTPTK
ncbi:MAG: peptidylprolyl isomerase [Gemmataceae bacterium]